MRSSHKFNNPLDKGVQRNRSLACPCPLHDHCSAQVLCQVRLEPWTPRDYRQYRQKINEHLCNSEIVDFNTFNLLTFFIAETIVVTGSNNYIAKT